MSHPEGSVAQPQPPATPLPRRGLLIGAGAAGAAVLAAKALPGHSPEAPAAPHAAHAAPEAAEANGGYRLSAHVLRYYESTRA